MIHYCKGNVVEIEREKGQLVLEVGGCMGLRFSCSQGVFEHAEEGEPLQIYVHLQPVEETGFALFGFASEDERILFSMLTTVRGVGNRMAMSIMASYSMKEIVEGITSSRAALFSAVVGIGKKISERLCFELEEKVRKALEEKRFEMASSAWGDSPGSSTERALYNTVLEALLSLGFKNKEAAAALEGALSQMSPDAQEGVLLQAALQRLQR